jgi:hypothetical protein
MRLSSISALTVTSLALAAPTVACVDTFDGSNVQIDLPPAFPAQASAYGTAQPGEWDPGSHFELYAAQDFDPTATTMGQRLFKVQEFEVHHIIDLDSPCFIDVGDHVPYKGIHVTQFANRVEQDTGITDVANPPPTATEAQKIAMATALQRQMNIVALAGPGGIKVLTTPSQSSYPQEAADCNGGDDLIPPPTCTDDASNARRLKLCQAAWAADRELFEGTDRSNTVPLNGTTQGFVDGLNPVNLAPVGGGQFFATTALDGFSNFALYQVDDNAAEPGTLVMYGSTTMPTRGVEHVHMVDPANGNLTAEMAIFTNLGDDAVHF